jgi:hypothetical protein
MKDSKRPPRSTGWLTMHCCQAVALPCASIPARTRDTTKGRYDIPCTSSSRVQTTCTGLPTAREASAASTATSE